MTDLIDEEEIQCHDCPRRINPYDNEVHVWATEGCSLLVCTECHNKRKD